MIQCFYVVYPLYGQTLTPSSPSKMSIKIAVDQELSSSILRLKCAVQRWVSAGSDKTVNMLGYNIKRLKHI